ncbi:MAG: STAS domain-containing protein [Candidatus Solibacter usitatus]|nr:STAS domain-containing protein [Candidatus Solibacter usitatus]
MPITIQTRSIDPDISVLTLAGRMHLGTQLQDLEDSVRKQIAAGARKLILDIAGVDYLDSAALGMLLMCSGVMEETGGKMALAGASAKVLQVMKVSHADKVLTLFPSCDDAAAGLSA